MVIPGVPPFIYLLLNKTVKRHCKYEISLSRTVKNEQIVQAPLRKEEEDQCIKTQPHYKYLKLENAKRYENSLLGDDIFQHSNL